MNFISLAQLGNDVLKWHRQLPDDVNSFCGIPRSGKIVAAMLSEYTGKQFGLSEGAMLVDDTLLTGRTMRRWTKIYNKGYVTGVVYVKPGMENKVDYFFKVLPTPRIMEWQIWRHPILVNCAVDIDGVLCRDPKEGENHMTFFAEVSPIIVPKVCIGTLVTARPEKARGATERWLRKHGYKWKRLIMRPHIRMRISRWKADVVNTVKPKLLVESSARVCRQMRSLTDVPILCWDTRKMV